MSSFTCAKLATWTLVAVLLQILGLSLFVLGFFPVKAALSGVSGPESYRMPTCDTVGEPEKRDLPPDELRSLYREMSKIPPAFDRLILMVVDGLPAEFVLGRGGMPPTKAMKEAMPYTQYLLSNGRAIGYHAKAAPPTVTMPRLKAMVSGAIGGFLDVAFNFNTQALLDDNLLDHFFRIGWKLVLLGDNTWIKLFPGLFTRQDGVSSFYVKDTVEVDFNVSRHLDVELAANDWNLLILHYLGLDHVGHIGGRRSVLMAPKLKEMDEVIKMIHMRKILHQNKFDKQTLLVVVSDHGMTDGGNHGGSSYEETDSLALFIGLGAKAPDYSYNAYNAVFQVDIAPTLALLFGVPIPKNSIGVLLTEIFDSLTDEQKLRALELNSWQLLRLLQAQLPGLPCADLICNISDEHGLGISGSIGSTKEKLCDLFSKAMAAHRSWEFEKGSGFVCNDTDDFRVAAVSYYDFLRNASEWLSHRATDRPLKLLVSGIALMLISCVLLLNLLFCMFKEVYSTQKYCLSYLKEFSYTSHLDEAFVLLGILIHVLSLGASSMVEEEQYTWHFLTSTLYLIFLLTAIQSLLGEQASCSIKVRKEEGEHFFHQSLKTDVRSVARSSDYGTLLHKNRHYYRISSAVMVLICGRMLRGWHQGGVNWTYLPDISKWLEQAGVFSVKLFQIVPLILIMSLSSFALCLVKSRRKLVLVVLLSNLISGLLVLQYIVENQSHNVATMNQNGTSIAQTFYIVIGMTVMVTVLSSPWIVPVPYVETPRITEPNLNSLSMDMEIGSLLLGIQDSTYLIGGTYTASWCLMQLILQQPINAAPILLLFLQILASMTYFSTVGSHHHQWVEIAAMYFLGMAGHFGLGNSNNLATVDVAGAFIGISSHSTVLAGILMFIITYASPILSYLSMVMYMSMKDMRYLYDLQKSDLSCILQMMIAFPCLLPLVFNSVGLSAFTIILLLMRNHLFVWSVFSPKYLYVCAATVSVYIGVCCIGSTGVYTCTVLFFRTKRLRSKVGTS